MKKIFLIAITIIILFSSQVSAESENYWRYANFGSNVSGSNITITGGNLEGTFNRVVLFDSSGRVLYDRYVNGENYKALQLGQNISNVRFMAVNFDQAEQGTNFSISLSGITSSENKPTQITIPAEPLQRNAGLIASGQYVSSSNFPAQVLDLNESTLAKLGVSTSGKYEVVFTQPMKITAMYISHLVGASNVEIGFFSGETLLNYEVSDNKLGMIAPLDFDNVTKVTVSRGGTPGSTLDIYEFDVYGAALPNVPATPTLTATTGDSVVNLAWNTVADATNYNIYRGGVLLDSTTATNYTDEGLINGQAYIYTITAANENGESNHSNEATATPQIGAPTSPTLNVTAGDESAALSWAAVAGADQYSIYRDGTLYDATAQTSYTDTGLTNGQTYKYYVTALNAGGESPRSNEVTVTPEKPPIGVPGNVTATGGHGSVTVTWDQVQGADGYQLYKDGQQVNTDLITATSYTIKDLDPAATYSFYVVAVAGPETSAPSGAVAASPTTADKSIKWQGVAAVSGLASVGTAISWVNNLLPDWLKLGLGIIIAWFLVSFIFWIVQKIREKSIETKTDKITGKIKADSIKASRRTDKTNKRDLGESPAGGNFFYDRKGLRDFTNKDRGKMREMNRERIRYDRNKDGTYKSAYVTYEGGKRNEVIRELRRQERRSRA